MMVRVGGDDSSPQTGSQPKSVRGGEKREGRREKSEEGSGGREKGKGKGRSPIFYTLVAPLVLGFGLGFWPKFLRLTLKLKSLPCSAQPGFDILLSRVVNVSLSVHLSSQ